jgi:hypothetical protein
VTPDDLHFWTEVLLPGNTWVAIEPTPGYRLMEPPLSLAECISSAFAAVSLWVIAHRAGLSILAIGLIVTLRLRRQVLDLLMTVSWYAAPGAVWRQCALRTLKLVEFRARWAGHPRPPGQTPARWYGAITALGDGESRLDLERLIRFATWAMHAPETADTPPAWAERDIRLTCRRAVRLWTTGRFCAVVRPIRREGNPA